MNEVVRKPKQVLTSNQLLSRIYIQKHSLIGATQLKLQSATTPPSTGTYTSTSHPTSFTASRPVIQRKKKKVIERIVIIIKKATKKKLLLNFYYCIMLHIRASQSSQHKTFSSSSQLFAFVFFVVLL